jgi:hypothetical protein
LVNTIRANVLVAGSPAVAEALASSALHDCNVRTAGLHGHQRPRQVRPLRAPRVALLGLADLARPLGWGARKVVRSPEPPDPDRRLFLNRVLSGGVAVAASAVTGCGMVQALGPTRVVDVSIELSRLPRELDGFTILDRVAFRCGEEPGWNDTCGDV